MARASVVRPARERGFTLVELIIALAIVGSLLLVAFGGLRVAVSAWRRGDEHTETQQHTRSLSITLARALSAAYPYRAARRQGETPVFLFGGKADRVEFVTPASPFPAAAPVAFTAVVIELGTTDDNRRLLVVRQRILPNEEPFLQSRIVFEDPYITTLALGYLSETGNWQDEWDAEQETSLPRAIKLTLGTAKGEGARGFPAMTIALGGARK
jgi:prepilin-type N-terminal cleavage/methylation domain-containing protein